MPVPAMAQAISAPATPVSWANRVGNEKTPAPTIEPTTIIVSVARVSLTAGDAPPSAWSLASAWLMDSSSAPDRAGAEGRLTTLCGNLSLVGRVVLI